MQLSRTDKIHSVSEINFQIKDILEESFPSLWVRGEVSNLRVPGSGHHYFSLKENSSQISGVLFRGDMEKNPIALRNGMQILAHGSLGVYPPQGSYQLIIRHIVSDGAGRLQLELEQLKNKLKAEGLFDMSRKKPIPSLPSRIAIITSSSGAALQDFLRILKRRNWRGQIGIFPCSVQGDQASAEIIRSIDVAEKKYKPDLILLTRGGGSIEDLWAFNNESLARKIADCSIPVISAVGHEIDFVLTDFVADKRAETPSGAAEMISSEFVNNQNSILHLKNKMDHFLRSSIQAHKMRLAEIKHRFDRESPEDRIHDHSYHLDQLESRMRQTCIDKKINLRDHLYSLNEHLREMRPEYVIQILKNKLTINESKLMACFQEQWKTQNHRIDLLDKRLQSHNHKEVLKRGYSLTRRESGEILKSTEDIKSKETLKTELFDGEIISNVIELKNKQ